MKNIVNKILSVATLVTISASLSACGREELVVSPEMMMAPEYSIAMIDQNAQKPEILVKFKKTMSKASVDEFSSKYGVRTLRVIPVVDVHVIQLDGLSVQAQQLVKYLNNDPAVKFAEINKTITYTPDQLSNPVYSIQTQKVNLEMTGEKVDVNGIYKTDRSGAYLETQFGRISIVDLDGTVLTKVAKVKAGSYVTVSGIVKEVKGFNLSKGVGIMPTDLKQTR